MTPHEKRFKEEKIVSIWSDWCSTGIWTANGVCVPVEWLPISGYAMSLLHAMQVIYDWQNSNDVVDYFEKHSEAYEEMQVKAYDQVNLELPDWTVL